MMIVFEGVECSGKSTQAQILSSRIGAKIVKESILPTDSLKKIMKKRADLFSTLNVRNHIPVIYDRFFHSTIAYQHYLEGESLDLIIKLHNKSIFYSSPEMIIFYLKANTKILNERDKSRSQEILDSKRQGFSIEEKFNAMEKSIENFNKNVFTIDANGSINHTAYLIFNKYCEYLQSRDEMIKKFLP